MDFDRGIWAAAVDGDAERVKNMLSRGVDPSIKDSAGYSALVRVD